MKNTFFSLNVMLFPLLLLAIFTITKGEVTITPTTACLGDEVVVSCNLTPPNPGDTFTSSRINFVVGTSVLISESVIDGTGSFGGVDLSKLMADAPLGNNTNLQGTITLLSYTEADNGTLLGCGQEYRISGTSNTDNLIQSKNVTQAAPPSPLTSLTANLTTLNPANCSGTVELTWTPGASNRDIAKYFLYLNGSQITNVSYPTNSYTHVNTLLLRDTVYTYSVAARSCAGDSTLTFADTSISVGSFKFENSELSLTYDNTSNILYLSWALTSTSQQQQQQLLTLTYSLILIYNHTQNTITYPYTNNYTFSQISNEINYNGSITPPIFPSNNSDPTNTTITNITALLTITQQCGSVFSGITISGFYSTVIVPTSPPITTATTATLATQPTPLSSPIVVIAVVVVIAIVLVLLFVIIVIVLVYFCFVKKASNKSQESDRQELRNKGSVSQAAESEPKGVLYAELDLVMDKPKKPKKNQKPDINRSVEETHYTSIQTF